MPRFTRISGLLLVMCLLAPAAFPQTLAAESEYALGREAEKRGDYRGALRHLRRAVIFDPRMIKGHIAIGDIVDLSCERDAGECELALEVCKEVLELDASQEAALKNAAYALYWLNRRDESERYYRKNLALRRDDSETLCALAAIKFSRAWHDVAIAKGNLGLPMSKPLIDLPACHAVRAANLAEIEEGIAFLIHARQAASRCSQLAGYLSPLYFLRAQVQCGDRKAYQADMYAARVWERARRAMWKRKGEDGFFRRCPPAPPPLPDDE